MRGALLFATLVLVAACREGGPTAPAAPAGTFLNVQLEAASCANEGAFEVDVYIDHVAVGTPVMSVGTTSSYAVTPGTHLLGAVAPNGRQSWAGTSITIPENESYTAQFACR